MQLILVMVDFLTSVNFYNPPVIWSVIFILKIWHCYLNFVLDLVCGRYWVSSPKSYESRGECQHWKAVDIFDWPSIDSSILTLSDNGNPFFKVSCSSSLGISCFLLFFWLHAEIGTRWGKLQCSDCDIVSKKFNWHLLILVVFLVLFFIFWNNSCSFVVRFRSFGYFCDCRKDFRYFLFPCSNFRLFMLESFC
jgi:hypothetical protein